MLKAVNILGTLFYETVIIICFCILLVAVDINYGPEGLITAFETISAHCKFIAGKKIVIELAIKRKIFCRDGGKTQSLNMSDQQTSFIVPYSHLLCLVIISSYNYKSQAHYWLVA